jgi:trk system potassium uptake protein TrkH
VGNGARNALLLLIAFAGLIMVGFGALRLPIVLTRGYQISVERSLFTVVNAATLTGFEQSFASTGNYHPVGIATISVLMLGGAWITLSLSAMAVVRLTRLGFSDGMVMGATAALIIAATLFGGAMIALEGRDIVESLFAAASMFTGCGLLLGAPPRVDSPWLHVSWLPLAVLGSLGIPTLMELWRRLTTGTSLSRYSRLAVALVAGAYLVGLLMLLATSWTRYDDWRETLANASACSITARMPGTPFTSPGEWSRPAQWVVIGLMLVGGLPASGAGGLSLITLAVIWKGLQRSFHNEVAGRAFAVAATWSALFLLMSGAAVLLLLAMQTQMPADRAIFLAISAIGCVGLSHDPVSTTGVGLHVLSVAMLVGRLVPIAGLWYIAIREEAVDALPDA